MKQSEVLLYLLKHYDSTATHYCRSVSFFQFTKEPVGLISTLSITLTILRCGLIAGICFHDQHLGDVGQGMTASSIYVLPLQMNKSRQTMWNISIRITQVSSRQISCRSCKRASLMRWRSSQLSVAPAFSAKSSATNMEASPEIRRTRPKVLSVAYSGYSNSVTGPSG